MQPRKAAFNKFIMIIKFNKQHFDFKTGDVVDFLANKAQAEYFISMGVAEEVKEEVKSKKKDAK